VTNARLVGSCRPGSARATTKPAIDRGRSVPQIDSTPDFATLQTWAQTEQRREGVGHARGDDRLARAGDLEKVILRCLRKDP
jgi:hypothetical protein